MDLFPEDVFKSYPIRITEKWKTLVTNTDDGKEFRARKWAFPKRIVELNHKPIKQEEIETIWQFYRKQKGAFQPFGFFYPTKRNWFDEYVATGDGSTTEFELPSKETTLKAVYIDGTLQDTSTYSIQTGTGTFGKDKITFTSAPANGAIITIDFEGKLFLTMRFFDDNLDSEMIHYLIYNASLKLIEVR